MPGPLALVVGNCDTVGEGLDCASRFLFVHAPALRLSREPDPERPEHDSAGCRENRALTP
ncbi:hypothetical protein [Streptomyces sp. YKOK-I1]